MRTILPALSLLLLPALSIAQCSEVFISEIVEGWSNNKAIEIYNPTGTTKDLSEYGIIRFQNGSTTPGSISYLTGVSVAPGDVVVIVLDKRNEAGTGLEAPVWDELEAAGDVFINPNYDNGIWPMYFNGNDAVALLKDNGTTLVDMFGRAGEGGDFGGWGPYLNEDNEQAYISEDHTLIRKPDVQGGVTLNPATFNIQAQWDSLPANTFDQLGTHNCLCTVGVQESTGDARNQLRMYPNPASGQRLNLATSGEMVQVRIYNAEGRMVQSETRQFDTVSSIDIADLEAGLFWAEVIWVNGQVSRQRFLRI